MKCKPVLRHLLSPDLTMLSGDSFSRDACSVCVQAIIGPSDSPGEESFDFLVVNSKWVDEKARAGLLSLRHVFVMDEFDIGEIERFWIDLCSSISGSSWDDVAHVLARYGHWEFEDYAELK